MNDSSEGGAPSWLFSFVDLAFLMVIAMTQLAADPTDDRPDLGEMVVPRISSESSGEMATGASKAWQLRVHPTLVDAEAPFELVPVGGDPGEPSFFLDDIDALRVELAALQEGRASRPVLAPHQDARSQDLLDAAAALEDHWPGKRRVTVARVFESP